MQLDSNEARRTAGHEPALIVTGVGSWKKAPLPIRRTGNRKGKSGEAQHQRNGCDYKREGYAYGNINDNNENQRQYAGKQLGHVAQNQIRARTLQQDVGKANQLDSKAATEIASGALGNKPLEQAHQSATKHDHDRNGPCAMSRLNKAPVTHRAAVDEPTRSIAHEQHRQQQAGAHRGERARHTAAEYRYLAAEPKPLANAPDGMVGGVRRDERSHEQRCPIGPGRRRCVLRDRGNRVVGMERIVKEQRDLALPDAKRGGDRGDADSGNRSNGNEQRALHELDDLALGGAGCRLSGAGRNLDRSVHDLPFKEGYVRKLM